MAGLIAEFSLELALDLFAEFAIELIAEFALENIPPPTLVPLSNWSELELYLEAINDAKKADLLQYANMPAEFLALMHACHAERMAAYTSVDHARRTYERSYDAIELRRERMENNRRRQNEENRRIRREANNP